MIATDASGEGSRIHGKTSQHVLDVEVVLRGGVVHRTARVRGAELDVRCAEPGLVGAAHKLAREIATMRREEIASTFPKLRRYMTGYNLATDGRFRRLERRPRSARGGQRGLARRRDRSSPASDALERHHALLVLRYPSFDAALASAEWLVATDPGSVETLDETVLALARGDVIYDQVRDFFWTPGTRRRAPSTWSNTPATTKPT
jgi:FAD/FMN-containing dehydrogenase